MGSPREMSQRSLLCAAEARQIDDLCDAYEQQWRLDQPPRIEDYLPRVASSLRGLLLRDLVPLDAEYRRRQREHIALDEYQKRFPEYSEHLEAAWTSMMAVPEEPGTRADRLENDTRSLVDGSRQTPHDPSANTVAHIGRYRAQQVIGQGGFGVVYLGHDDQLQRAVAIKMTLQKYVHSEWQEMFLAEARATAQLDHPHIVPIYDVGQTVSGDYFTVSKFIRGCDLATRLKQQRPSVIETVEIVARLADALHYTHTHGLVHRDVKPANVLIDNAGQPYLADFGLALRDENIGKGQEFVGTLKYMSPEQLSGQGHRVDGRTDIFSLGVVLYELLTGRHPFPSDSQFELSEQVRCMEAKPPRQINDEIPPNLEQVCLKALSKSVNDRYSTAKDLANDLEQVLSGELRLESTDRARPSDKNQNEPAKWWLLGVSSALLLVAILVMAVQPWKRYADSHDESASGLGSSAASPGAPTSSDVPPTAEKPKSDAAVSDPAALVRAFRISASRNKGAFRPVDSLAPLLSGDYVRFSIHLTKPSYVCLLWFDATGKPQELYPQDPEAGHRGHEPVIALESPTQLDRGWPLEGGGGTEMAVLLASRSPFDRLVLDELQTGLPADSSLESVRRFVATRAERASLRLLANTDRSIGTTSRQVDDAVMQLLERLRSHADVVQAVAIPYRADGD